MKVLFLTIGVFKNVRENGIYTDLLRCFIKNGHEVCVVCAREKRQGLPTCLEEQDRIKILRVKVGNITKVNFIEKGISTVLIARQYRTAINKYFGESKFDMILYATPPVTLASVVTKLKKKNESFTYLMLKDIWPAGAVDLGVLRESGIKGMICAYLRKIEKRLYGISDGIGCMSEANIKYVLEHNPQINPQKVGLCPNTIDVVPNETIDKKAVCEKYKLPENKMLFIYGGNFGRPQNVDYIIDVLQKAEQMEKAHFIMCGSGTEFYKIQEYGLAGNKHQHVTVINALPYQEYKQLLKVCDVGMLFLDYRFHVPNFPSRLLDYMNYNLPVLAATDVHTDVGQTIVNGKFGWWCESRNSDECMKLLQKIVSKGMENESYLKEKGKKSKEYLEKYFRTDIAYSEIMKQYKEHIKSGKDKYAK